ncbi:DUF1464 family protein [Zavarzinella formosa]|uniref:DUF1464 family protein n=1 Tax=Zavarzinella formosa TaxID=360055 RepID=UPI000497233A|nr:DUF1464 family protein [Zavarzinella formosa]
MARVAGCDPGTSSLDMLVLDDGQVAEQIRFSPAELRASPSAPVDWLRERGPFDLIAGPSGYGVPLVRNADLTDDHLNQMTLVRPDERGTSQGVLGFSAMLRAFRDSALPVVFLPGVIHLPTVPDHRKFNRIDLGTADKLAVASLAIRQIGGSGRFLLLELGSAFTALIVVHDGQIIHGIGGSAGPIGGQSGGAWDGEAAYWLSPLRKQDLFTGGVRDTNSTIAEDESLRQSLMGLYAVTPFETVVVSGKRADDPAMLPRLRKLFPEFPAIIPLPSLPGAWVKTAAQGAAIIAEGLATDSPLMERLQLRHATGSVLDWLRYRPT